MARLTDLAKNGGETECPECGHLCNINVNEECPECGHLSNDVINEDPLIESLQTLIEMVEDNLLLDSEVRHIEDTIAFISEDDNALLDEALKLKKMSIKDKMRAKKYRMKNKAKLKIQAKKRSMINKKFSKKRKACAIKIAGKSGWGCSITGKPYKVKERK